MPNASEAFTKFGETHREMEKFAIKMLKKVKPMISDMGTFLHKAVPDTRLTIKKYADCKFEYLSYCLKVSDCSLWLCVMTDGNWETLLLRLIKTIPSNSHILG